MVEVTEPLDRVWKPSARQAQFLRIPNEVFEGFYGGAAGGGKSEILLMKPVARRWIENPKFKAIIFRRTFPQLEESLIERSKTDGYYAACGAKYNSTNHVWRFPSGATIRFGYMEKDSDARDHDTAEYNYAAFDELTHFSEYQYRYLTSRVRTSDPALPAIVRSASNPGNVGHAWVRARFVEPEPSGGVLLRDTVTGNLKIFIPAKLQDNPALMKADPNYYNRLMVLPEAERKAKMEGDWWTFAGQVFTEFRYLPYPNEPDNALHVIPHFNIPYWWPKLLYIDWGFSAMTYAGWLAISPDERIFQYREYAKRKQSVGTWGAELRQISQFDQNLMTVVIDPSAKAHYGDLKSIGQQFIDASGFDYVEYADNDRISGKILLHDFLRWTPRPARYIPREGFQQEVHDRIFRWQGTAAAQEYLNLFKPDAPETNIPRLQIMETCPELIKSIQLCTYDEKNIEDVAEFSGDDPYDGLRYGLKSIDNYLQNREEVDKRRQYAEIMHKFKSGGDATEMYRALERFEAENAQKVVAISRRGTKSRFRRAHV